MSIIFFFFLFYSHVLVRHVVDFYVQRTTAPLTAVSDQVVSYKPVKSFTPIAKPHLLDDGHPYKYYMSGTMRG